MTTRRSQRRAEMRERDMKITMIVGGALILALAGAFIALRPAPQKDYGRVPRANRVTAANMLPTDGTSICDKFPQRTGLETSPPKLAIDRDEDYAAWIDVGFGTIVVDLYANIAPQTVNNFIWLSCADFYSGLGFHRVIPGFMAQGGDPNGDGSGGPGYTIPDEFALSDLRFDKGGLLSMAHTSAPNSAGSQFFITYGPTEHLDNAFTIFGEVVSGMEVVEALAPRDPQLPSRTPPDRIVSIIVRQVSQ